MNNVTKKHKKNINGNVIDLMFVSKVAKSKTKEYKILNNISLSIEEGSFVVIIGKSGSGKTTLMNVMSGMTKTTTGDVVVLDCYLSNYNNSHLIKFRKENVSFIFQDYGLLSTLNVLDNIKTGLFLSTNKLSKNKIENIIKYIGLENELKKMPNELSGGQQQRVSIARALAKNPKIIFADEPTGSLDSYTAYKVLKTLKSINNNGTTIIIVTHDSRVAKIADHIIEIFEGKIILDKKNKPFKNFKELFI